MEDPLREVLRKDRRYARESYHFVQEALEHAFALRGKREHVTGQDLLDAIKDLAGDKFGLLAPTVFRTWGVDSTLDFGHIVFNLVGAELMSKRPEDSLEDFREGFDFAERENPEAG